MAFYDWSKNVPTSLPTLGGTQPQRSTWSTPTQKGVQASLPSNKLSWSVADEEEDEDELRKKIAALPWNKPTEKAQVERPKSPYVSQTKEEIERKYGFTPTTQTGGNIAQQSGQSLLTGATEAAFGIQNLVNEIPRFISMGINTVARWLGADQKILAEQSFTEAAGDVVGSKKVTKALELASGVTALRQQQQKLTDVMEGSGTGEQLLSSVLRNVSLLSVSSGLGKLASTATQAASAGQALASITKAQKLTRSLDMPTVSRTLGIIGSNLSSLSETSDSKEIGYQWTSALTEGATELMFGVFDELPALMKLGRKAFPTAGAMLSTYLRGAVGEGVEEALQYVAQTGIDYLYYNDGRRYSDMFDTKEMGMNALAGALGSFVFTTYGTVRARGSMSPETKATYDILARHYLNKPIEQVTVDDIDFLAQIAKDAMTTSEVNIEVSAQKFEAAKRGETWTPQPQTQAESVTPRKVDSIPDRAENIVLDERIKTVVYRDETTGNFVVVEPVSKNILGDDWVLNNAVMQVRSILDNADENNKYYNLQVANPDIVTDVTEPVASPVEPTTSDLGADQASDTTTAQQGASQPSPEATAPSMQQAQPEPTLERMESPAVHYGNLGKSEFLSNQTGSRGTGHYGTGTYFVSPDSEAISRMEKNAYGNRPKQVVSLDEYNLYKPTDRASAGTLHNFLSKINNNLDIKQELKPYEYDSFMFDMFREYNSVFPRSVRKYRTQESLAKRIEELKQYAKDNSSKDTEAYFKKTKRLDSASTLFMKEHGYQGVDVRGIKGYDDEQFGTVVYDYKQPEPAQSEQRTGQRAPVQEKAKAIYQAVESAETDADIESIVTQALDANSDIVASLTEKIGTVDKLAGYMTEARASLIRGSSMTFGGRGMGLFLSLRDSQEFSPEKVAKTNIIILQRFAERVLNVPKGSRVSNYLGNMIKYLNKTLPPEQMERFESTFADEDLWYEVLHNADVVKDANSILEDQNKSRRKKSLDGLFDKLTLKDTAEDGKPKQYVMQPHEMVALSKWAMELISTGDEASMLKANAIISHIRERMTASGQFSNAAKVVYDLLYPERVAERLKNEAESGNDPIKQKRFKDATEKSATTIRNERKKAATDAVEDVTKKTPAEILRDRILADLKPKTKQEVSDVQKMINTLFRIYKETNRATRTATDPYEAIADMVMNRAQYATVWNKAKELILQDGSYDQRLIDYIQRLADPTITKRSMDLVIAETIRQMKDAPAMVAKRYFLTGGESITEFMQLLRTNMPELDDASFKYLSDAISDRFKERMEIRRASMRAAIEKQFDDAGGRIRPKAKSAIDKAVSQMMDAAAKNAFDFDPIRRAWAERLGLTALSQKAVDDIYSTMRKIAMATDDETKETLYYDMINRIGQEAEGTWFEKYLGWRRLAMLGNPVTVINNGMNNYLAGGVYRMSDRLTALFDRISGDKIDPEYRTFGERVIKEGENAEIDSAVDRQTERKRMARIIDTNMKYTVGRFFNREKRIFKNKKLEYASKAVQQIMSTGTATHDGKGLTVKIGGKEVNLAAWLGDAAPLRGHVRHALRNRLYSQGYHNITDAKQKLKVLEEATDYAIQVGLTRTFRQKTILAEKILSFKSGTREQARIRELVEQGDMVGAQKMRTRMMRINAAVDVSIPFVTTLFALTDQAYKFSPIALAVELGRLGMYSTTPAVNALSKKIFGTTVLKQQDGQALHDIHAGLAQALTGTASSFIIGLVGGFLGVITGSAPDNDKEKKLWAQEGKLPFSVYIPGIGSFSLANMAPVALPLIMGAEFAKQTSEKNLSFEGMTSAGIASFDAFIDNTIIGELLDMFGGGYGKSTMSNTVREQGQDGLFQFFPSVTRRINRAFDLYERDIYTGNAVNILKNKVLSYVPFGTFLIPPKVDIWGNKVKQTPNVSDAGGVAINTVKNLLLPFITKGVSRDAVTTEVSRVFNVTGKTDALPIVAQKTFKTKIGKTEYSEQPVGKEWETYQTILGQLQHEYADIVIDSDRYRSATDDERVKLLKKAYAKASEDAKEQYVREKYKIN